jgi:hypothetical protein
LLGVAWRIWLNDRHQPACICQSLLGNSAVQNLAMTVLTGKRNALRMTCAEGRVEVDFNGERMVFASHYKPTFDHISISWLGEADVTIERLELSSYALASHPVPARASHFQWQMTVDFVDDIIPAPCTRGMLDAMMKRLAEQGYEQVNWIYHGDVNSGFWDATGNKGLPDANVARTFADLGESDLKAAVVAAHKAGLRLHATIKPFDLSIAGLNFPLHSPLAAAFGKNDVLGGKAYWGFHFPAEHPELCMRRRELPPPRTAPIERVIIASRDTGATLPANTEVWISDDNWKYRRYTEPFHIRSAAGQLEMDGLRIVAPFFAIRLPGHEGRHRIHHILSALIRIYDTNGKEIPFTYGLSPRSYQQPADEGSPHLGRIRTPDGGFAEEGFFFDSLRACAPSSVWGGDMALGYDIALDNDAGVLGIALGKNACVPGVMCPSEPGARAFWKGLIAQALDHGVDGVNLRVSNHSDILEWREYGFNAPMVQAYRERYGVDALTQAFDMEKWRRLRGEFYTGFLTEAQADITANGKSFALHISDMMQGSPEVSTMMEIHWDWGAWIRELRPDQVTMKLLGEDSYRGHHCREVVRQCAQYGIPVILCPFLHSVKDRLGGQWIDYFEDVKSLGFSGFDVYEHATCSVNRQDGGTTTLIDLSEHIGPKRKAADARRGS